MAVTRTEHCALITEHPQPPPPNLPPLSHLEHADPEVAAAIGKEGERQRNGLEMIASENIVSEAVLEALGTPLTNKDSEGDPGKQY